jgi:hypothetical protein
MAVTSAILSPMGGSICDPNQSAVESDNYTIQLVSWALFLSILNRNLLKRLQIRCYPPSLETITKILSEGEVRRRQMTRYSLRTAESRCMQVVACNAKF